jgi:hypothetical protein
MEATHKRATGSGTSGSPMNGTCHVDGSHLGSTVPGLRCFVCGAPSGYFYHFDSLSLLRDGLQTGPPTAVYEGAWRLPRAPRYGHATCKYSTCVIRDMHQYRHTTGKCCICAITAGGISFYTGALCTSLFLFFLSINPMFWICMGTQ